MYATEYFFTFICIKSISIFNFYDKFFDEFQAERFGNYFIELDRRLNISKESSLPFSLIYFQMQRCVPPITTLRAARA